MNTKQTKILSARWRLAALTPDEYIKLGLTAVIIGLGFLLFHLQGNTTDVMAFGRSVLSWMVARWVDVNLSADFSHGWLIPIVSGVVVYMRRKELALASKRVNGWGLACVVASLFLHWVGARMQHPRISLIAFIGVLWSVPFYFYGWQVAKILMFPCAFLIFCIPLNFLDQITLPLRMTATKASAGMLNGVGIAVERHGSGIYSKSIDGFKIDVADPCSGLRSLIAMTALTSVYAYLAMKGLWRKWMLFLFSVPIAICGNIGRIFTIGLMAEVFGEDVGTGLYHDYSGYLSFGVAIVLMVSLGALISLDFKKVFSKWKQNVLNHSS